MNTLALGSALRGAKAVALTRQAITPEAEALDAALCVLIEAKENRRYRRGVDRREALLRAVSAFLGGLLFVDRGEWIRHSTDRSAFTGGPVSYRNFAATWTGMEKAGLIDRKPGHAHLAAAFRTLQVIQRYETRFRATPLYGPLPTLTALTVPVGTMGRRKTWAAPWLTPSCCAGFPSG
jgi:hypothetical protein